MEITKEDMDLSANALSILWDSDMSLGITKDGGFKCYFRKPKHC